MNLLQLHNNIELHSNQKSNFKIECDALTNEDIDCAAYMLSRLVGPYRAVSGVPRGGLRLAEAMAKFTVDDGIQLIVDDVFTTGTSIKNFSSQITNGYWKAAVIFSRGDSPSWLTSLFSLNSKAYSF
jgi:hypothetical protein